ncbi:DMT family transporter [Actinoplanes sp. NPDC023801]|uniref:DMT family transporter n=1 Tax=Actinoplanes sp. NPDC023801 TaxID=3154595 RepID=UPI0033E805AE
MKALPALAGALGMAFVGGSVAVSGHLADAPMLTVQALRYTAACLLLLAWAHRFRLAGRGRSRSRSAGPAAALTRPRGAEWLWLLGVTVTGLLIFNVALVQGSRHAEPAVIGVAVACVPIILAAVGPLLEGRRPAARILTAAVVVTVGAILVQGLGRTDATGLFWAAVTFGCEAAFTLLAVPVLGRHGPLGVSVHATWMGAAIFAVLGLALEGPGAVAALRLDDLLAGAYLAVLVTAVAFLLWYTCVARIGAGPSGLLTGVAPIAAAVTGVALGGPAPAPPVWLGIAAVAAGLALGLSTRTAPSPAGRPPAPTGRTPTPAGRTSGM